MQEWNVERNSNAANKKDQRNKTNPEEKRRLIPLLCAAAHIVYDMERALVTAQTQANTHMHVFILSGV